MNPNWLLVIAFTVAGVALVLWAGSLSIRYNTWTTRFRERNPDFNPPPTPEWRARNTAIMTVLFRVAGFVLIFRAVLTLVSMLNSTH